MSGDTAGSAESLEATERKREKCSGCGYRVTQRFKLESEDRAVCGDCLCQWLIKHDYSILTEGETA